MSRALSATDRAYQETRAKILDGVYAGGDVITEGQVASTMSIIRTPVREAFLRLQAEGMLQLYPKRGAVVVPVAIEEALPVMEAREVVEAFAITKVLTENAEAPAELIATLWDLIAEMTRYLRSHDVGAYVEADTAFHMAIVGAGGNPFFEQFNLHLREKQRRLNGAMMNRRFERMERSYAEHVSIVEQLEAGNLDQALSQLRAHLRAGRLALHGELRSRVS